MSELCIISSSPNVFDSALLFSGKADPSIATFLPGRNYHADISYAFITEEDPIYQVGAMNPAI